MSSGCLLRMDVHTEMGHKIGNIAKVLLNRVGANQELSLEDVLAASEGSIVIGPRDARTDYQAGLYTRIN